MKPDQEPVTPPSDPSETGKPPATPPSDPAPTATPDDDEMVTIPKKDLKALQSQRDSNFETSRQTQAAVEALMKKDYVKDFLSDSDNAQKFPDVEIEDLLGANDEDEVIAMATSQQQRVERLVQKRLDKIEVAEPPTISAKDKAAQLKSLDTPQPNAFQKFLKLSSMKVSE